MNSDERDRWLACYFMIGLGCPIVFLDSFFFNNLPIFTEPSEFEKVYRYTYNSVWKRYNAPLNSHPLEFTFNLQSGMIWIPAHQDSCVYGCRIYGTLSEGSFNLQFGNWGCDAKELMVRFEQTNPAEGGPIELYLEILQQNHWRAQVDAAVEMFPVGDFYTKAVNFTYLLFAEKISVIFC